MQEFALAELTTSACNFPLDFCKVSSVTISGAALNWFKVYTAAELAKDDEKIHPKSFC